MMIYGYTENEIIMGVVGFIVLAVIIALACYPTFPVVSKDYDDDDDEIHGV